MLGDGLGRCGTRVPGASWPVIGDCQYSLPMGTSLACAFPDRTDPGYGPFVGCCPFDAPFACPNGTPWGCFGSAVQASQACGSNYCLACSAPE